MINDIKKIFFLFNFNKKYIGFLFLVLIFGLFLPIYSTKAFIVELLSSYGIVLAFLQTALSISNLFLGLGGTILSWILGGDFITIPYTKGDVIDSSWGLVRDLTNMLFIIVLIFIGLATALRIRDYEAKKALPRLIIIALLINFTPVICGFIIDGANIVMNFFIQPLSGGNLLGSHLYTVYKGVWSDIIGLGFFNPLEHVELLFKSACVVIFNFLGGFIMIAFSFLFVLRYIAIWILVILSPLAFFSYILPITRRIWTMWWNQFIQWVFIGITGAFFLYLGFNTLNILLEHAGELGKAPEGTGWLKKPFIDFFNDLLPYGIGIAFLLISFFLGFSTGAMGGNQILNLVKTGGATALGRTRYFFDKKIGAPTAARLAGGFSKSADWARRIEQKGGFFGVTGKPLRWVTRGFEAVVVPPLVGYSAEARKVIKPKGWERMTIGEKAMTIKSLPFEEDRLVLASEMKQEKDFLKTDREFQEEMFSIALKFRNDPYYKEPATNIINALPDRMTKQIKLDLTPGPKKQEMEQEIQKTAEEIRTLAQKDRELEELIRQKNINLEDLAASVIHIKNLKPSDLAEMNESSLTSLAGRLAFQKMTSSQTQKIFDSFGKNVIENLLNREGGLNAIFKNKTLEEGAAIVDNFCKNNKGLVNYLVRSPAGQAINWEGLKYMLDPLDRLTNRFADLERRILIQEKIEKSETLKQYYELFKKQKRGEIDQNLINTLNSLKTAIENNANLKREWEIIENLIENR